MIDAKDQGTQSLDLGDAPKRRGRPSTGKALSNADRQRAYRERQKAQRNEIERELENAEATLRVDQSYTEGVWQELEQARTRIAELEKELHEAHLIMADQSIRTTARIQKLEDELESRNGKSKTEAAGGTWTLEFKAKGQRKWTRLDQELKNFGPKPMTLQDVKNHVIQVQIHSKVAQHWRAVRDDGLTWEATTPK